MPQKKCFKKFSTEISEELLETTLKFLFNLFLWVFYYKNQDHAPISEIYFTRASSFWFYIFSYGNWVSFDFL